MRCLIKGSRIAGYVAILFLLSHGASHALTSVTSCGTLSNAGETYRLDANLTASGTCLTIEADNVTLDGNGHSVTYSTSEAGFGIDSNNHNVTIYGLTVIKGAFPISGIGSHGMDIRRGDATIRNNTFQLTNNGSSALYGMKIRGGSGLKVHNNTFNSSGSAGIVNLRIEGNVSGEIYDNQSVIGGSLHVIGTRSAHVVVAPSKPESGRLVIRNNTFTTGSNTTEVQAIQLYETDKVDVHHNTFIDNGGHSRAILFDKSDNGTVYENVIHMNGNDRGGINIGIRARYGSDNLEIHHNTVDASSCEGDCAAIYLGAEGSQPFNLRVHNNSFSGKDRVAYFSQNIRDTEFVDNTISVSGNGTGLFFLEWSGVMENISFHNTLISTVGSNTEPIKFVDTGSQGATQGADNISLCGVRVNNSPLQLSHITDGGGDNNYQVLDQNCEGGSGDSGADGVAGGTGNGDPGGNDTGGSGTDEDGGDSGNAAVLAAPRSLRRTDTANQQ